MFTRNNLHFSRHSQRFWALALALGLVVASPAAAAPSDADRATARQLGYQGVEAYQAGDFKTAEDKLHRAFAVVKVPTLGLWLARTLTKNRRWVEAAEVYREVSRLEVTEGKVEAQREAQQAAERELGELVGKIPTLVIVVEGTTSSQVVVQVDGVSVASAVLGEARPVNPGQHQIVGKFREQVVKQAVDLAQGQKREVKLVFAPEQAKPVVKEPKVPPADVEPTAAGNTQRIAGWAVLGVGAAGLVTGGVTGLLVLNKKSEFEHNKNCEGTECGPGAYDEVDSYNRLRKISSVSFIVGGVAAALGTTLLLTSDAGADDEGGSVSAYVGIGHAGLLGSF